MNVLYFGTYTSNYPRNRNIIKGLQKNGVEVIECSIRAKPRFVPNFLEICLRLIKKYQSNYDAMIVGFPGHSDIPLAKLLTKANKKPLIFDAFLSLYDSAVFDRKVIKEGSLKSKYYYYQDKFTCFLSDIVLLDTNEHINYFHKEFGINKDKFRRVFVGTDEDIFYPRENTKGDDSFIITFHGKFIPLHGIQYIVGAAKLLENCRDIRFEILGSGQTYNSIINLANKLRTSNIIFREKVKYEELPNFIKRGDVCLGIFGDTAKAKRVIPNKVFEILAMRKPLITGDSPAIKEASIVDRKNALLVELGGSKAIANAILELKEDKNLRNHIAKRGYRLFKKNFTQRIIGQEVKKILEEVI